VLQKGDSCSGNSLHRLALVAHVESSVFQYCDCLVRVRRVIGGTPAASGTSGRMRYAFDCQGQALNKFQMIRVDYLDRSKHWTDYQHLITRPANTWLQFNDAALVKIYSESAGNPYYSVLICRSLFSLMVSRRDSYVTESEAEEAVALAISEVSIVNFQHFWDDAIIETGPQAEDISMRRRYVLLSLAEAMGHRKGASREAVATEATRYGLDARTVGNEINEFIQREVLVEKNGELSCKVPFLGRWLPSSSCESVP
jgi:hypothetical protein